MPVTSDPNPTVTVRVPVPTPVPPPPPKPKPAPAAVGQQPTRPNVPRAGRARTLILPM